MRKTSLALYNDTHFPHLENLLKKFQEEVYKTDTNIDTDSFVEGHHGYIYMVLNEDGTPVGFSSFTYNPYYGLREATLGNDYIYIEKEYRRSKAMHLISIQAGILCQDNNVPLEHYVASDDSERFNGRLSGRKLYSVYEYDLKEVSRETERLKTKVRIK